MHSLRTQVYTFLAAVLLVMLLLLNTYPIISARESVFEEKKASMTAQAAVLSASLGTLDRFSEDDIAEVLQLLDIQGYERTVITDTAGTVLYDSRGTTGVLTTLEDLSTALTGKTVFRSRFNSDCFLSSCAIPLYSGGLLRGALCLTERDSERAASLLGIEAQLRILSLLIVALVLLVAVVFTTVLLRRIRALVSSMRVVATGDYAYRHVVTGRDEIAELGTEFNELTEQLEENEKQRRRFVADASHELKTPLASIRLLSDSIVQSEGMDTETMRDFVTDIGAEADRLQRTTEKLLDLSRLDDDVRLMREPVDMKQVTNDAVALLRPLMEERSVTLSSRLEEGCVVMATTDDMFHIIFNLIENAVKYNVEGGRVILRLFAEADRVSLEVADTGIGIPEEDRYNIFTRFYRVDKARSREAGGSGLGLSIVHDAVIAHGGTITVGANKPNGSVFVVSFPRPAEEETGI